MRRKTGGELTEKASAGRYDSPGGMKMEKGIVFGLGALLLALCIAAFPVLLEREPEETAPATEAATEAMVPVTEVTVPEPQAARTSLPVLLPDGTVEEMELESYLVGVVLGEMPAQFAQEARKAQAVVARTFALRRMEHRKHEQAAVCTDPACCQCWIDPESYLAQPGSNSAGVENARAAVLDTAGQVLTYGGTLIEATYFSCSGGRTEAAVAVWGSEVPYLQSVDSPGETEIALHDRDETTFPAAEFAALLQKENPEADFSGPESGWVGQTVWTVGGGVETVELGGASFRGTRLRSLLGLRSTVFSIRAEEGTVTITTRGYGHRVGMSQYGAQAMALAGKTYPEILAHYYVGTCLETRNP